MHPRARFVVLLAVAGCGIDAVGAFTGDDGLAGVTTDGGTGNGDSATGGGADGSVDGTVDGGDANDAASDVGADVVVDAPIDVTVDAGPCGACPPGTAQTMCVQNACVATRRVFLTNTRWTANLGGVTGADDKCQTSANAASLGGTWRAWVSVSGNTPNTRFVKANVPYRLLNGDVVADDWDDLTDGNIDNEIDRTENNVAIGSSVEVWTATNTGGNFTSQGCNGFTSGDVNAPTAAQGVTDKTNADWTNVYNQFCDRNARLYCFEQ